jgi:hypothetical protein
MADAQPLEAPDGIYEIVIDLEQRREPSQIEHFFDAGGHVAQAEITAVPPSCIVSGRDQGTQAPAAHVLEFLHVHDNAIAISLSDRLEGIFELRSTVAIDATLDLYYIHTLQLLGIDLHLGLLDLSLHLSKLYHTHENQGNQ